MNFKITSLEVLNTLLPEVHKKVSKKEWRRIAITNAYIILGMVLAKDTDIEELKELVKKNGGI